MLGADRVLAYVERQPNGKYARQLGYLYELLAGEQLPLQVVIGGAYVDLLDADKYLVAAMPDKSSVSCAPCAMPASRRSPRCWRSPRSPSCRI
ncbi:hypothetical protein [Rugamonas rubra]|uniref:hypothetical protein n=1 Tax=Rugamonas rubra TaxID=758825 RepID=UPI0015818C9F|nr:hypothetical protein [Rugamonas rubra]